MKMRWSAHVCFWFGGRIFPTLPHCLSESYHQQHWRTYCHYWEHNNWKLLVSSVTVFRDLWQWLEAEKLLCQTSAWSLSVISRESLSPSRLVPARVTRPTGAGGIQLRMNFHNCAGHWIMLLNLYLWWSVGQMLTRTWLYHLRSKMRQMLL